MKPAIIVVDMLKDTFKQGSRLPITQAARQILPNLQRLLKEGRKKGFPVVYACDSFLKEDFIFKGKIKFHSIQGTEGAEVVDDLKPESSDMILRKRHFSAFFGTGLEQWLRRQGVDTILVTGITTEVCVLTTAMDGLCHDLYVIILEDCSTSSSEDRHRACLGLYRDCSLHPLLRIMTLEEFLKETSYQIPPVSKGGGD
jgi:nicotinamidase/pyrazinamidase